MRNLARLMDSSALLRKDVEAGLQTSDFNFIEIKKLTEEGQFEGYGSVYGVTDTYGEVVVEGAFDESLSKFDRAPPLMLWQHMSSEPIGIWLEMKSDKKGLYVKGQLLAGVRRADEALILLRAGAIKGLSIGYRLLDWEVPDKGPVRLLKIDLWEVSLVSFPANRKALISRVKNEEGAKNWERLENLMKAYRDGEPPPIKEFEDILREAGAPKSVATRIASVGYAKANRSESGGNPEAVATLTRAVDKLNETLKTL